MLIIVSVAILLLLATFIWQWVNFRHELDNRYKALLSFHRIYQLILEDLNYESMIQRIADIIPTELRFATGVLAILDEKKGTLKRVSASQTRQAIEAIKFINTLSVPFEKIEIPVTDSNNIMAKAIRKRKRFVTSDIYDVLGPVLPRAETEKVQQILGTKTTFAFPIFVKAKPIGIFLASTKKRYHELSKYELEVMDTFVNLIGLALQDSSIYSALRKTSYQLEVANRRLEEVDKLKDEFVSVASHELRTPMTAIRSYAWMALNRSDVPLSEKLKKYLSRTMISTERLINLVNDMLNISRIEAGRVEINPRSFNISELATDVLSEIAPKASEKNISLHLLDSKLPLVFADSDKVHQVLLNLVGNSLKFTQSGGSVTVSFFTDGKDVEVSVKDNGVGITREDLTMLFKKFSRLDNSYVAMATSGGTGLGLYISKSLVELMHGRIWASSEGIGKGSTFTFSLPVATESVLNQAGKYAMSVAGEAKPLEPVAI